jgi:hypothetical protein
MQNNSVPWLGVNKWVNGRITSGGKLALYVLLGFAVFWNLVIAPIIIDQWDDLATVFEHLVIYDFNTYDARLIIPLMLAANVFLIPALIRQWRQWSKFGRLYMTLDPYPGVIGGQIGGYLDIPTVKYRDGMPVDVRVNCVKISISGSGKSHKRSDSVAWRKKARAAARWSSRGARVEFVVDVDDDLPQSTLESGKHGSCYWSVRVRLPEAGFDRHYEIPVFRTEGRADSKLRPMGMADDEPDRTVEDLPAGLAELKQTGDDFSIQYPPGRSGGMGNFIALFGVIFFAIAVFLGFQFVAEINVEEGRRVSLFSAAMLGMMTSVFGLVSCGIMAAGWFVKTNHLRVIVDHECLTTERHAFGRTFRKLVARANISGFDKKVTMQSGQGAQAEIYYSILAQKTDGQTLTVGDHIHGQEDADVLLEFFRRHVAAQAGGESQCSTGRPPVPPQIRWIVAGVKSLSVLIFIAMMAAFILDFST